MARQVPPTTPPKMLTVADAIALVLDGRYDGVRMIPTFALYWEEV